MALTSGQFDLINAQLELHNRGDVDYSFCLGKGCFLDLRIDSGVFGSDIMSSSSYLAWFLHNTPELYKGKDVVDMGCGMGLQGIVMLNQGAKLVVFSDVDLLALVNTDHNLEGVNSVNYRLYDGDLFSKFPSEKYDLIVFNPPFFSSDDYLDRFDEGLVRSMIGEEGMIERFLKESTSYLNEGGKIVMPFFEIAGSENDPVCLLNGGLEFSEEYMVKSTKGLLKGDMMIYVFSKV